MHRIDLNSDVGESFGAFRIGADEELLPYVTSANIACGFHAGDPRTMRATLTLAARHGVAAGAHPGFPDLVGFGRRPLEASAEEVYEMVVYQVGALQGFAVAAGVPLRHVKPHGALYNMAAGRPDLAGAVARAVHDVDRGLILFGLAGSELVRAAEEVGLTAAREAFVDREYLATGTLVPRTRPDAMIHEARVAVQRAVAMVLEGGVRTVDGEWLELRPDTVCIHGDTPGAVEFARELRHALEGAGVRVAAVGTPTSDGRG